jgi:CheY-like chemotaxis protein
MPPYNLNDRAREVSGMTTARDRTVLIADDDDVYRETLRDIVEPEGYRAVLASSGEEAIDIIQDEAIDLALLDLQMPRMTGLETVEIVHQINALLPCILVTGNATQEVIRQAFQVRVYSVIPKPVSRQILLHTMLRALKAYEESLGDDHE